ncbi:MAG: adenosylcobinamide-GDP ribazoletransferase [Burkholderiales bacterium]
MLQAAGITIKLRTWCIHQVRLFFIALQFFTRLPIPGWVGFDAGWLPHASRYFALVGIVVGAVASAIYAGASWLFPQLVAVLLSTISGIYLTGALHEDGFADTCDGLAGATTSERALEIMKDSRIGVYGAIGVGLLLALKCAALFYLPTQAVVSSLLIAHPLSRLASSTLIWRLDYVRAESKAKPLAQSMSTMELSIVAVTSCVPIIGIGLAGWLPWHSIVAGAAAAALAALWLSKIFVQRIGGYTGDCLGAVQQVSEVAFYLGVLACMQNGFPH